MKKLLVLSALISALAFGAEEVKTVPTTTTPTKTEMGCSMMKDGGMMGMNNMMMSNLSEANQKALMDNRTELKKELSSKTPDWKKVQKLNEKNSSIMAKAKTEMMKKHHTHMMDGSMDLDGNMMNNNMDGNMQNHNMHQNMSNTTPETPVKTQ